MEVGEGGGDNAGSQHNPVLHPDNVPRAFREYIHAANPGSVSQTLNSTPRQRRRHLT
jgi:hypothetical protein